MEWTRESCAGIAGCTIEFVISPDFNYSIKSLSLSSKYLPASVFQDQGCEMFENWIIMNHSDFSWNFICSNISIVVTKNINYIKFISSTGGAENVFANVSIGYTHCIYYLSLSGPK